ncbi:hypothetical protein RSSM_00377, partial [Rhodopirellula sallentina SM41]
TAIQISTPAWIAMIDTGSESSLSLLIPSVSLLQCGRISVA